MKSLIFVFLFLTQVSSLAQVLEHREKVLNGFEKSPTPTIKLYSINNSDVNFDSIALNSDFLDSIQMEKTIVGFRIDGINLEKDSIIFTETIKWHIFPESVKRKISDCKLCSHVKLEDVTIKWFTGTYGIKTKEIWEITK